MKRLLILLLLASPAMAQTNTFCAANLPCTTTANNTHSGTETFTNSVTIGNWNSVLSVDGVQYTTCDAAVAAAVTQAGGSGRALVIVPSTYAGAACTTIPTNPKVQVWYFNGQVDPGVQSGIFWNNTSATPIHSWLRVQDNDPSPAGSSVGAYFVHRFSGAMPAANAMDAISPEVQSTGAITSWGASAALQSSENVCTIASTGSTISQVFCTVSYMRGAVASTTNVSNAFGFYAPTMVNSGTGIWTNVYGGVFDAQNAGTSNNLSLWAKGAAEFDGQASYLCTGALPCISQRADTISNNEAMELADTHAGGHTWWLGEQSAVTVFNITDRTQTNRPSWGFQVTGSTAAEGRFVHANTANRIYSFPDASGPVPITPNLLISSTAPTIAAAGCGGAAASIPNQNGTASFNINVGTTPTAGGCTVTLPTATTGWNCFVTDITTNSTSVFLQKQLSSTATQVVLVNYSDVAVATAPTASDIWRVSCHAY